MKQIAIVTGATGGIGEEFVKQLIEKNAELQEIWAIGRNQTKLDALVKLSEKIVPIQCDLGSENDFDSLKERIEREEIEVRYLINNAGLAKMAGWSEISERELAATVDINCKAVVLLCSVCVKKMSRGCRILNISSASSFQPNPYIALYSATKVFVKNYSRAINYELKSSGITCTAVCPGWVDTKMLQREHNGKAIHFPGMVSAGRVVTKALKDANRGRDMSVCSLFVKYEHVMSKLWPNKVIMRVWAKGVEKSM